MRARRAEREMRELKGDLEAALPYRPAPKASAKRTHSAAFEAEEELETRFFGYLLRQHPPTGELSPTTTLAEMIEYKRRQNTIAARKSLEHQRALEGEVTVFFCSELSGTRATRHRRCFVLYPTPPLPLPPRRWSSSLLSPSSFPPSSAPASFPVPSSPPFVIFIPASIIHFPRSFDHRSYRASFSHPSHPLLLFSSLPTRSAPTLHPTPRSSRSSFHSSPLLS
ncbi:hypothetical protein C8J57DRAFT_757167 [Mycena rebaudengoi]|nr:hypothetical protein C8J57DRAFT_757167 [Mycena rebaudengoi]